MFTQWPALVYQYITIPLFKSIQAISYILLALGMGVHTYSHTCMHMYTGQEHAMDFLPLGKLHVLCILVWCFQIVIKHEAC